LGSPPNNKPRVTVQDGKGASTLTSLLDRMDQERHGVIRPKLIPRECLPPLDQRA